MFNIRSQRPPLDTTTQSRKPHRRHWLRLAAATVASTMALAVSVIAPANLVSPAVAAPASVTTNPPKDWVTCARKLPNKGSNSYYLNRWLYCERAALVATYTEFKTNAPPRVIGRVHFTLEIVAQGDPRSRRVRVWGSVQTKTVSFTDWSLPDWVRYRPATKLTLTLDGHCVSAKDTCDAKGSPHIREYTARNYDRMWHYWDFVNSESSGVGRDKVSYGTWNVVATSSPLDGLLTSPGHTAETNYRCDSATYLNPTNERVCVFSQVSSVWPISLTGTNKSIAKHIKKAQDQPDSTYPLSAPAGTPNPPLKNIPGKWTGSVSSPGLHRLQTTRVVKGVPIPGAPQYDTNAQHKDGACYDRGPFRSQYVLTGLHATPNSVMDCDEYPFRITREGAASPDYDFSVAIVDRGQNRSAGSQLLSFMNNDRQLAWDDTIPAVANDKFWVEVTK